MNQFEKEKRSFLIKHSNEAQSLVAQGKKEKAIKSYDLMLEKYPDEKSVLYGKGMAYYEFDEFTFAIECFDKILEKNPDDVDALYAKGSILRIIDKKQDALTLLKKTIELNPKLSFAWLTKGYIYLDLDKAEEALESFIKVEELGRGFDALAGKGHSLLKLDKQNEADKCFKQLLKIDPYDPEALHGLGIIEYQKNNLKQAQDYLYKSVVQDDNNLDAWIFLVEIFKKTKQTEREKIALEKIAELEE
ncbi:MAG: tetratricopeptide repeat protein [Asgard group archaeon]|nr:tetratricopeptide repeat protein [Asgard group archaeon]